MTTPVRSTLAALAVLVSLTGCSAAQDKAKEVAGDAACTVATKAVRGVAGQVDAAIDQIGVDPAAAEKKLTGLRDAVKGAEDGVGGDVKTKLADARAALDDLVTEAHDAAEGADVDTSALTTSKQDFSDAVDAVTNIC